MKRTFEEQAFTGYKIIEMDMAYSLPQASHQVFTNLSLDISSDRITVVLGKSGCGKTTLLRLLAGLEKPLAGQILYYKGGQGASPKVGMVFQESRLFPWLRVEDNITIHAPKNEKTQLVKDKYLKFMGLEKFARAYPSQLSGGMAQKVAIARALAYEPDILLMDEPFTALDYFTRLTMQEEILRIFQQAGIGIVFVTHNVEEAMNLADELLILQNGGNAVHFSFDKAGAGGMAARGDAAHQIKQQVLELLK